MRDRAARGGGDRERRTVGAVLEALYAQHRELRSRIVGDDGGLHRFVNVDLRGEDIRFLDGLDTPVRDVTRSRSCPRSPAAEQVSHPAVMRE